MSEPQTNIKVSVSRDPELESLRSEKDKKIKELETELEEKKNILTQSALDEFEKLKEKLADKFNDDSIKELGTPSEVYSYIAQKETGQKPSFQAPAGRAPPFPPSNSDEYADKTQLIDSLYNTAYYDPTATIEQKQEAKQKINQLFESLVEGPSWRDMKEGGLPEVLRHNLGQSCPKCHGTVQHFPCKLCGFDFNGRHRPYMVQNGVRREL